MAKSKNSKSLNDVEHPLIESTIGLPSLQGVETPKGFSVRLSKKLHVLGYLDESAFEHELWKHRVKKHELDVLTYSVSRELVAHRVRRLVYSVGVVPSCVIGHRKACGTHAKMYLVWEGDKLIRAYLGSANAVALSLHELIHWTEEPCVLEELHNHFNSIWKCLK